MAPGTGWGRSRRAGRSPPYRILPPFQRSDGDGALDEDGSAGDYGDRLLPELVDSADVHEHRLDGYWRDVGTIGAYHRAHMELVAPDPPMRLDDPQWPLRTGSILGGPARIEGERAGDCRPGDRSATDR